MPTGAVSTVEIAPDSIVLQRFSRVQRVTGIEPALSAWEAVRAMSGVLRSPDGIGKGLFSQVTNVASR